MPPRGFANHPSNCQCILCRVPLRTHRIRCDSWVAQTSAFVTAGYQSCHFILRVPHGRGRDPPQFWKDFCDVFVFESSLTQYRNWVRLLEDVALIRYNYEVLREFGRVLGTDDWLERKEVKLYESAMNKARGLYHFFAQRREAQFVAVSNICGKIARIGPDAWDQERLMDKTWDGAPETRSKAFNEERIMFVPDETLTEDLEDDFSDCEGSEYDFFSGGLKAEVLDRVTDTWTRSPTDGGCYQRHASGGCLSDGLDP
ncbi:hypothetical protein BJ508DRAFT_316247 [Ascobolus immersus RN42]|uniref:Uncharacterized protein n=1 Tax=Ascobolus immersus RN42 TaxID=1160509 RepID=A0A3N4HF13_ASCIM|nr:hypothetical protein BJ508DRAFT_316247 [Ascobolus immersus RN42]